MRVAALYDIHGNLPALEATLADVRTTGVDLIVVGGDVFPGPLPVECLELLSEAPTPVRSLTGDGESQTLALAAGDDAAHVPEPHRSAMRAQAAGLGPEVLQTLSSWPRTLEVDLDGRKVLFCHATPTSDRQIFTRQTPDRRLTALLGEVRADTLVCGHTHMQFERQLGTLQILNAGSVGMPFGEPGAFWLLLDERGAHLRCSHYEPKLAAARLVPSDYALAQDFVRDHVLERPTEESMLRAFAPADTAPVE